MRVAIAQLNATVGDIAANVAAIEAAWRAGREAGAALVVTPELSICGYPPRDLLDHDAFLDACEDALTHLAARCADGPALVVGLPTRTGKRTGRPLHNLVAVLDGGREIARQAKALLPVYDVFDEARYFDSGTDFGLVELRGARVALTICEDIWADPAVTGAQGYAADPVAALAPGAPALALNLAASPFHAHKTAARHAVLRDAAARLGCPVVYCNQVGGNDELLFDGGSGVMAPDGRFAEAGPRCEAWVRVVDAVAPEGSSQRALHSASEPERPERIWQTLVMGVRDYFAKTGFRSAVLGVSGGIDSAVVAALAVDALGADRVRGLAMPSRYSSQGSIDDAVALSRALGFALETVSIEPAFDALLATLEPVFAGAAPDVTEENLQARVRGVLLMAVSNKTGALLLTTGNKSELATGYCTLYGDMCGALAPLSDVPKTWVYELARWRNREGVVIPEATLTKAPSAELRPDQRDQDSLPTYDVLDAILEAYVERCEDAAAIVAAGHDPATVARVLQLVDRNEYKRRQAAPGLKITPRAFGVGRRMPIAARGPGAGPR